MLDDGKWIVNVRYETATKIAQSVKFELNRYLMND